MRVVLLGPGGDIGDGFLTAASIDAWIEDALLPPSDGTVPVAAAEIERLRARALAGLEVVLGWARRRGVLTQMAADQTRLVFDAAMLGVIVEAGIENAVIGVRPRR